MAWSHDLSIGPDSSDVLFIIGTVARLFLLPRLRDTHVKLEFRKRFLFLGLVKIAKIEVKLLVVLRALVASLVPAVALVNLLLLCRPTVVVVPEVKVGGRFFDLGAWLVNDVFLIGEVILLLHLVVHEHKAFVVDSQIEFLAHLHEGQHVVADVQLVVEQLSKGLLLVDQTTVLEHSLFACHQRVLDFELVLNAVDLQVPAGTCLRSARSQDAIYPKLQLTFGPARRF